MLHLCYSSLINYMDLSDLGICPARMESICISVCLYLYLFVFSFYCICLWICLIGAFARHEWHPWRELLPGELSATDFAVVFACICIISYFYLYLYLYWCDQDICGAAMAVWSEGPPRGLSVSTTDFGEEELTS